MSNASQLLRPANDEEKLLSGVAYLGCIPFFLFIPTLIILVLKKESPYIKFHCFQALSFLLLGILALAVSFLQAIFSVVPFVAFFSGAFFAILMGAVGLLAFIYWLILAIKAFGGDTMEIPYVGPYIRTHLLKETA